MGMQHQRREREARRIMDEGASARERGASRDTCPYHSRVELRELWIRGWEAADRSSENGNFKDIRTF